MRHHVNPDDCFIDTVGWRSQFQTRICFTALLARGSGLQTSECCCRKPLVKGRSRIPSVGSSLPGCSCPALVAQIYLFHLLFAMYHRVRAGKTAAAISACKGEFGVCPAGSCKVIPEETRSWLNYFAFFAFSKWNLTGFSLFPNRELPHC